MIYMLIHAFQEACLLFTLSSVQIQPSTSVVHIAGLYAGRPHQYVDYLGQHTSTSVEWFQKGCLLSLVVFMKKSQKLVLKFPSIASRDKPPENIFLCSKNTVSSTWNIGLYLRNLQIASFCILISYFMESKLKKITINHW